MVYIMERSATHFFMRAQLGRAGKRTEAQVDEDFKMAAELASLAAPYRNAKLSAIKLAGDPNNPPRVRGATLDELRAEVAKHLTRLSRLAFSIYKR
jgi:hypothetical protein